MRKASTSVMPGRIASDKIVVGISRSVIRDKISGVLPLIPWDAPGLSPVMHTKIANCRQSSLMSKASDWDANNPNNPNNLSSCEL